MKELISVYEKRVDDFTKIVVELTYNHGFTLSIMEMSVGGYVGDISEFYFDDDNSALDAFDEIVKAVSTANDFDSISEALPF